MSITAVLYTIPPAVFEHIQASKSFPAYGKLAWENLNDGYEAFSYALVGEHDYQADHVLSEIMFSPHSIAITSTADGTSISGSRLTYNTPEKVREIHQALDLVDEHTFRLMCISRLRQKSFAVSNKNWGEKSRRDELIDFFMRARDVYAQANAEGFYVGCRIDD